jgi:hypothetical protein
MAAPAIDRTRCPLSSDRKHPGGRPEKFSPDLQTRFCQLIRSGWSIKMTCQDVGITTTAFVQWRKKGREESVLPEEQRTKYHEFYLMYLEAEREIAALKKERKVQEAERARKRRVEHPFQAIIARFKSQHRHGSKKNRVISPNLNASSLTPYTLLDQTVLKNPFIAGCIFPTDLQMKFLRLAEYGIRSPDQPYEAFLSGAGSSGKTTALLLAALQFVAVPEYKALLLRASPVLGLLPAKMRVMLGDTCKFVQITTIEPGVEVWVFPSGSQILFGHVNKDLTPTHYKNFRWHFIGFDELTHFPESDYLFSFNCLEKTADNSIPLRVFSTGCPDGPHRDWIKRRFIHCADDELEKNNRVVLHTSIDDNIYVRKEEIEAACRLLDPITQQRLLFGNWDI